MLFVDRVVSEVFDHYQKADREIPLTVMVALNVAFIALGYIERKTNVLSGLTVGRSS